MVKNIFYDLHVTYKIRETMALLYSFIRTQSPPNAWKSNRYRQVLVHQIFLAAVHSGRWEWRRFIAQSYSDFAIKHFDDGIFNIFWVSYLEYNKRTQIVTCISLKRHDLNMIKNFISGTTWIIRVRMTNIYTCKLNKKKKNDY